MLYWRRISGERVERIKRIRLYARCVAPQTGPFKFTNFHPFLDQSFFFKGTLFGQCKHYCRVYCGLSVLNTICVLDLRIERLDGISGTNVVALMRMWRFLEGVCYRKGAAGYGRICGVQTAPRKFVHPTLGIWTAGVC